MGLFKNGWWTKFPITFREMTILTIFNNLVQEYTPWKFNIAPENKPSQKESNLPTIIF